MYPGPGAVSLQVFGQAVWEHPRLLLVPLFVLLLCLALGLFGVLRAAAETRSENRAKAHRLAEAKAYDLHASLAAAAVPCRAAASLVQIHWRNPVLVNRAFAQQAPYFFGLAQDRSVYALSFAPQAVIGAVGERWTGRACMVQINRCNELSSMRAGRQGIHTM